MKIQRKSRCAQRKKDRTSRRHSQAAGGASRSSQREAAFRSIRKRRIVPKRRSASNTKCCRAACAALGLRRCRAEARPLAPPRARRHRCRNTILLHRSNLFLRCGRFRGRPMLRCPIRSCSASSRVRGCRRSPFRLHRTGSQSLRRRQFRPDCASPFRRSGRSASRGSCPAGTPCPRRSRRFGRRAVHRDCRTRP